VSLPLDHPVSQGTPQTTSETGKAYLGVEIGVIGSWRAQAVQTGSGSSRLVSFMMSSADSSPGTYLGSRAAGKMANNGMPPRSRMTLATTATGLPR
jgi:hypothetical protein